MEFPSCATITRK